MDSDGSPSDKRFTARRLRADPGVTSYILRVWAAWVGIYLYNGLGLVCSCS